MRHDYLAHAVESHMSARAIAKEAARAMPCTALVGDARMQGARTIAATAVDAVRIYDNRRRGRGVVAAPTWAVTCNGGRVYVEPTDEALPMFVAMVIDRTTDVDALADAIAFCCPGYHPEAG